MRPLARALTAVGVGLAGLFAACNQDSSPPVPCLNIPPAGCPLSGADSCRDPSCRAVYACDNGTWRLDHACGPHDAGVDASDGSSPDASHAPRDASVDAPPGAYGGPGCADLQPPDCPLGTALDCSSGCCGCENLFVCSNGAWAAWGSCSADAGIVQR